MSQAGIFVAIGGYGIAVVIWLMAWKAQTEKVLHILRKFAEDTHTLVNSNMGVQLKLAMELSDFKAATTKRKEDLQAAKLARHRYEEHVKKQAVVDRVEYVEVPVGIAKKDRYPEVPALSQAIRPSRKRVGKAGK